ncbi:MAG: glycosyltransferase, partial [Acidimicrobiales bacterium]
MRVLAACSLGGAGHFGPMLPLLSAAQHGGAEVLVAGPPAIGDLVERAGYAFGAGGEPPDDVVAPIREQLATVTADEASILANRDLFGHLATKAMVGPMEAICAGWGPDLVLRDPCEYASAVVGPIAGIPVVQVAISFAQAEWGSIEVATPALEAFRTSLPDELRASPYVTSFPASLDPSPFARTIRFHPPSSDRSPGKWW